MDALIPTLIIINLMLATALVVAKMMQMDRHYARQVREQQAFKDHFRDDRWK